MEQPDKPYNLGNLINHADRLSKVRIEIIVAVLYCSISLAAAIPIAYFISSETTLSFFVAYAIVSFVLAPIALVIPLYRIRGARKIMRIDSAIQNIDETIASIEQYITFLQQDPNDNRETILDMYSRLKKLNLRKQSFFDMKLQYFTERIERDLKSLGDEKLELKELERLKRQD